jgi:hypothetical protein
VLTAASDRPDGGTPFFVVMMTFFLGNFCLLMAVAMITMSEVGAIAGILITNISVPLFLGYVSHLPGVAGREQDAAATWSPTILTILGIEAALVLLSLGLAFYIPSHKQDLV